MRRAAPVTTTVRAKMNPVAQNAKKKELAVVLSSVMANPRKAAQPAWQM